VVASLIDPALTARGLALRHCDSRATTLQRSVATGTGELQMRMAWTVVEPPAAHRLGIWGSLSSPPARVGPASEATA
jgi:hypothetical protein